MVKGVVSVMLVLLLAGCSETVSPPTQKRSALVLRRKPRSIWRSFAGSGGYPL
nr:Uncharacterised protein [Klebsiella pneumoniae]